MSLSDILRNSNLTRSELHRVETALQHRDSTITSLDSDVRDRDRQIGGYKQENGELRAAATSRKADISRLEDELKKKGKEVEDWKERKEVADGLLRLGRQCIEKKDSEISGLRERLGEAEGKVSEMREQVVRIGMASQTEQMAIANQISADRTLELIKGLQGELGQRDDRIRSLGEGARVVEKRLASSGQELQRLEERLKVVGEREGGVLREVEARRKEVDGLKAEVERLRKNAVERDGIAREQQKLIERLIKGS